MASQWLMPDAEIENKDAGNEQEELFVFGYACKLFRDDEKAKYIDNGRHLIPWMGDDRLLIDRYDGRGHLYDLSQYDVINVKPENRLLSDDERQIEALCEEERYLELHTDVAEKRMYEEEEWKRYYETLSEGYNAVGFSYDHQHQLEYQQTDGSFIEEKPFVVPEELQVPDGLIVPTTEKVHAIIEKTAKFIAAHGMQMEIIIKAKQKNNSQFDFMHFEDELNQYYKHVLQMIKSGKYKPNIPEQNEEDEDHDNEDHSHHHGYLHPSLMPKRVSPTPEVGSSVSVKMPAISIHDTPYGQLIKSLKKTEEKHAEKTNAQKPRRRSSESKPAKAPPPPPPIPTYIADSLYGPAHPNMPLPPGLEPVTLPSSNQPPPPGTDLAGPVLPRHQELYGEEDVEEPASISRPVGIVPPPPDIQPVIDRMAMYVAKNGEEFEIVVKSKKDQRFDFLHSWHEHFPYYNFKKNIELKEVENIKKQQELEKPKGVSFSIKNKVKEQDNVAFIEKRQVFDNESSDDERDGDSDGFRHARSDVSGTSTPIDSEFTVDSRSDSRNSFTERKAEDRLKDRLAAAAREKLAQASREKQMQAERKRKAAMFINMLKSTNQTTSVQSEDSRDNQDSNLAPTFTTPSGTPLGSRSQTPVNNEESTNGERSNKRSRDRSRSSSPRKSKRSPSPYSRSKKSRSRSPRRRRRSPTPPSAYSRVRRSSSRSPVRWGVPRATSPTKWRDRSRSPRFNSRSRSPSISIIKKRDRSDSPRLSRTGSMSSFKRSRSRSPSRSKSSKKDRKSSPSSQSSKKSKKKKKSRSRSRSPSRKSKSKKIPAGELGDPSEVVVINDDSLEEEPEVESVVEPLEEGEIDSRLTPVLEESQSPSSRIPAVSDLTMTAEDSIDSTSVNEVDESSNISVTESTASTKSENQKAVSNYMLNRVRAIIKASRQAVLKEEGPLDDDS